MPVVPVAENRVGIAEVSGGKFQPADYSGSGAQALGAGLQEVGQAGAQYAKHLDEILLNEESAAAEKAAAQLRLNATLEAQKMRDNAAPGAAGHLGEAAKFWDDNAATTLDGITDKRVKQRMEVQLAESRTAFLSQESAWADQRRVDKLKTDDAEAAQLGLGRIATAPDLATGATYRTEERANAVKRINGYVDIPDDQRAAMLKKFDHDSAGATLDMGVRTDWQKTKHLLDTGAFNSDLSADEIKQGYSGVATEQRRAQALAEHQAALAKAAAEKAIGETKAKLEAGVVVPDAELQQTQALAQSIGSPAQVIEIQAARVKSSVNRETQGWTPSQFAANIATLRAKGEKRSDTEDMRLKQLETISDTRTAEFNKDPYAWGALNGFAAQPLNFSDPGSIAARQHLQATLEGPAGQPIPFLKPDEVSHYKAIADAGPKGRFDVVNTMAAIPDPHTAQQAIRQILPDDALAARLVVLNPSVRAGVMSGAEARKADKTIIDGKGASDPGTAALEKYQHDVEPALALLRPEDAEATYQIAGNLYANWAHQNGVHDFSPDKFGSFLHMALGARRDQAGVFHGGVGYWNDKPVMLPSAQSQRQFETVLSRMTWKPDNPHAPVFATGAPMTPSDIRKLTPIQRPDGAYEFHGENGVVATNRNHQVWTFDIDKFGKGTGIAP